jgi:membrane associated rhomboid family serine protease
MGIYDRDYFRNEGPSFLGSFVGTGRVCMWLVAINAIVYLVQLVTFEPGGVQDVVLTRDGPEFVTRPPSYGPVTEALAMKPREAFQGFQIWRFVTGMFLHSPSNFWHIVWNMLFLWVFGRDLEDLYGRREFLAFYLVAGILANIAWGILALWQAPDAFHVPMALGASGAVMAVMVLCALLFPTRVIYLMFVLPVPYWAYVLILVVLDLSTVVRGIPTGVGVTAHLAGAAFGFIYWKTQMRILSLGGDFLSRARRGRRPRLRVLRDEEPVLEAAAPPRPRVDPELARRADTILEKISRQGQDSLTEEEREVLRRASEEYKRRQQ